MVIKQLSDAVKEKPTMEGAKGVTLQWLITKKDGAPHYAMRLFTLEPAGDIPVHQHDDMEHEIYVVEGEALLKTPDGDRKIKNGDALLIPAGDRHGFFNVSRQPFKFICVIPLAG